MEKSKNPVILSDIHHRQNPLKYTDMLSLHYRYQPANVGYRSSCCLLWESYESAQIKLRGESEEICNVKAHGTYVYSNYWALKSETVDLHYVVWVT
jgi:hypothetical protein